MQLVREHKTLFSLLPLDSTAILIPWQTICFSSLDFSPEKQQPFKAKTFFINKVLHFTFGLDIPGSFMEKDEHCPSVNYLISETFAVLVIKTSSECVLGSVEESIQLDHDCNSTEESSTMQLVPPRSPEISGVCGHPIDNPRVGDEYQAEIPSMISQAEHLQLVTNPFGSDGISGPPHSFLIDNRKTKRKKCVYGHRIFTGWRQQELFSRLDPHVPEHFRNTFQEVSMEFTKGKISLEDYVFKLKATVGIQFLVEAVGIGKGKNDLTGLAMEPVKSNPLFPDCPVGKDYCSLTASEIIKLLTGGFRLSKARSNDIFWEAVWPRLLARGWHSEQPMTQGYVDTNHYLVFLIPGIKKFSRGKLVKGNHYFDSVSDVLSKVASEPMLIELEAEETRGSICNEEDGWDPGEPSNLDDQPICQPRHFLKPHVSKRNLNHVKFTVVDSSLDGGKKVQDALVMPLDGGKNMNDADCNEGGTFHACSSNSTKFTIVDTSLLHGGISARPRELRCLPVEYGRASEMTNSTANETDFSESSLVQHAPDAPNRPNYRRGYI
ncbi:hypothetical protein OIU77_018520 [Salix suchowensis]|uniref:Uncharacterized protein n=1 Tax=Salix suchowensis TaxID=1278906 RepID=A0ABQ9CCY6_9ROSI|nr:hypothetical protein OIU77_018520 [Salix suchowensis]